ncbi:hypothetical protein CHUAL_005955 [Chamberlinius hualienensis]
MISTHILGFVLALIALTLVTVNGDSSSADMAAEVVSNNNPQSILRSRTLLNDQQSHQADDYFPSSIVRQLQPLSPYLQDEDNIDGEDDVIESPSYSLVGSNKRSIINQGHLMNGPNSKEQLQRYIPIFDRCCSSLNKKF